MTLGKQLPELRFLICYMNGFLRGLIYSFAQHLHYYIVGVRYLLHINYTQGRLCSILWKIQKEPDVEQVSRLLQSDRKDTCTESCNSEEKIMSWERNKADPVVLWFWVLPKKCGVENVLKAKGLAHSRNLLWKRFFLNASDKYNFKWLQKKQGVLIFGLCFWLLLMRSPKILASGKAWSRLQMMC